MFAGLHGVRWLGESFVSNQYLMSSGPKCYISGLVYLEQAPEGLPQHSATLVLRSDVDDMGGQQQGGGVECSRTPVGLQSPHKRR